jgi:hypothetical protein
MFEAAIPVLAVTEITAGSLACFFLKAEIMALSNRDFPLPEWPNTPNQQTTDGMTVDGSRTCSSGEK